MKALSDLNRVRALKILEGGALCGCEIQEVLGLAQGGGIVFTGYLFNLIVKF